MRTQHSKLPSCKNFHAISFYDKDIELKMISQVFSVHLDQEIQKMKIYIDLLHKLVSEFGPQFLKNKIENRKSKTPL